MDLVPQAQRKPSGAQGITGINISSDLAQNKALRPGISLFFEAVHHFIDKVDPKLILDIYDRNIIQHHTELTDEARASMDAILTASIGHSPAVIESMKQREKQEALKNLKSQLASAVSHARYDVAHDIQQQIIALT